MDYAFMRFLAVALSIWGALHFYVFWRLAGIEPFVSHLPGWALAASAIALWSSYLVARVLDARGFETAARWLEPLAAGWIGLLFLLFTLLLLVDILTLGGRVGGNYITHLRGGAVLLAVALSVFGTIQATRAPTVRETEVSLPGLPLEHDGLTVVLLSDLHLGSLLGGRWLDAVVRQVDQLQPDIVAIAGDVADHDFERVEALIPRLRQLQAPLGVWAVTGNHDAYAGLARMQDLMRNAGFRVLSDEVAEVVPGLTIAGIDDLSVHRPGDASLTDPIERVLGQARGAVIFLSHTPSGVSLAAKNGAGLMLSGHTHGGQIWPFNYLVRSQFAHVGGSYQVGAMTLIVCRGTGTWGPRMRVWRPSEIWRIRLRAQS